MSDTTRRISGTASLTIDGVAMPVVANPKYRLSTLTRETQAGMDGIHGYSEKPQAAMIGAQIRDMAEIGIAGFEDMTNVTVELMLANGKVVTGTGMWLINAVEVNSADATFDVEFHGDVVQ